MVNTDLSVATKRPYEPSGLSLFSIYDNGIQACNRNAIMWSGSSHIWGGTQYSPYGNIDMSGADNSTFNTIIGFNIYLSGSAVDISATG